MTLQEVDVDQIAKNPNNPRQNVSESGIDELAASIDEQGLLQPPLVRPNGDGFELVHGERRIRAVESLGWDTVAVNVEELSDADALELAITENLQREDVTPIGEARSYQMLIDEHGLTQAEAADRLGVSQADISNKLGLLDLPDELQESILRKIITPWQAKELARVWGDYWLFDLAVDWDLSVRELRGIVDDLEDGAERVSFERRWSRETLRQFWGLPEDVDGELERETKRQLGDGSLEEIGGDVLYTDGSGNPVPFIHEAEQTAGLHWARENIDGFEYGEGERHDPNTGAESERLWQENEVRPIRIFWPKQFMLLGYFRLKIARIYDYDDDLDVELLFTPSFFDWEKRCPTTEQPEHLTGGAEVKP